jgi:hypothetical protein
VTIYREKANSTLTSAPQTAVDAAIGTAAVRPASSK